VAAPFYTLFPFATNVPYQLTKLSKKIKAVFANFVAFDKGLEWLISAPGCSLSAGRAVSLLGALRLRGLTCPAAPAGVSHLPLQSTYHCLLALILFVKQQSFRKEP
jgi:hypothetical protein